MRSMPLGMTENYYHVALMVVVIMS
jgi:hypothetical protein